MLIKRTADILAAILLIVLFAPVVLVLMIVLRLTGEGAIFYRQERIGFQNKKFRIWKFTTMIAGSPKLGQGDVTIKNDPRILPVGHILRKTKLDELPQIINLLLGNMSLVGPRPLMVEGFERYPEKVQASIYNIKPGITGIGSILFRDEVSIVSKSIDVEATYQQIINLKGELEIWYQHNRNTITDVKILFLTVWVIARPKSLLMYTLFPTLPRVIDQIEYISTDPIYSIAV